MVLDYPRVGGKPGRPKGLPDEAYADRGYDSEATREFLRWLGIEPYIAKRRTPLWQRAGEGPLGRGADDQLAQGPEAVAGEV